MGLLKWLGIHEHEWSPWKLMATANISRGLPPLAQMFTKDPQWYVVGEARKQERACKTCGLNQIRVKRIYY